MGLPAAARAYVCAVTVAAAAALVVATATAPDARLDAELLVLLAVACAGGSALETLAPGHYALQPNYAFLVAGAVLLPPPAIGALAAASFVATRTEPHKTVFNVANYVLTGLLISAMAGGVLDAGTASPAPLALTLVAVGVAGAAFNHGLIVLVVALAGQMRLRATLPQLLDGMPLSMGLGLTGGVLAVLWSLSPWLLLVAAGPLALVYRALWVPMLRHQATTDAKTGLLNHERFMEEFEALLAAERARGGTLAVAMIDLDHLRRINTRCGHLGGDRAIRAVADELAAVTARHGLAARFGGEEFCLLLPGMSSTEAAHLLGDIQDRLRRVEFRESQQDPDLRITFSAGVAVHPEHGQDAEVLLEHADVACYDAKAAGRDRVRIAVSGAAQSALEDRPAGGDRDEPAGSLPAPDRPPAAGTGTARIARVLPGRLLGRRRRRGQDLRAENAMLRGLLAEHQQLIGRMQQASLGALEGLARAAERYDGYPVGHAERVGEIARGIAGELGLGPERVEAVGLGARLHDIGKLAVPERVLRKGGKLDPSEVEELRANAKLASRLIADLELPVEVKQIVRSGHERYDGSGYPDGLAGEEIPLAARVLAVAEALDAMTSDRPYRAALAVGEARQEIEAAAGAQFCPDAVAALGRWLDARPPFVAFVSGRPQEGARAADAAPAAGASAGLPQLAGP